MADRRLSRVRRRCCAGVGVLVAGLSLAPPAVSDPTGARHAVVAAWQPQSWAGPAGGGGHGWGDGGGGPGGWNGQGGQDGGDSGGGWHGGGDPGHGSGGDVPAPPPAPAPAPAPAPVAVPAPRAVPAPVVVAPVPAPPAHGNGNGNGNGYGNNGWHGGGDSGQGNGGWHGNGDGNGNGNSQGGSTAASSSSSTGLVSHVSTSTASGATAASDQVTPAAAAAPASAPSASAATTAAAPASAAPASAPAAPTASASAATPAAPSSPSRSGTAPHSSPAHARGQRASQRSSTGRRPASATAGARLAPLHVQGVLARQVALLGAAGTARVATAGAAAANASAAGAAGRPSHGRAGRGHAGHSSTAPQPLGIFGHELSNLPNFVGRLVPLPVPDWSKPIIVGLIVICLLLGLRAWLNGLRARRLETQRTQMAADLASLQAALIPEIPRAFGALDVSVAYRPAEGPGAGGDFYDAFALDRGRVAVILGDVSGHGRCALGRAAHMHYTLRAYVEMGLEPRAALKLAGRVLGTEANDLFATVVVAVHDPSAGTLTYASAGHPAPLLLGAADGEPLAAPASPALGWGVTTGRRQSAIPFPTDARACFFTDGVTEARIGGGLMGRDRLAEIAQRLGPGTSATDLIEEVRRHADAIHDDMAACVIEATAGTAPAGDLRVEEFEVSAEHLADRQGERFLQACGVPADEAAEALAAAQAIAAESGAAVLRVEIADGEATASATGPGAAVGVPAAV